jgi:bifunctional non-homologous end joining protein LigD
MLQRPLPAGFIAPCLPTKTDKLPSGSQWLHEIKHDGFRIIARKNGAQVRLYSRPGNDLTRRFPLIVEMLGRLRSRSCIIDREAVACDDNGVASFDLVRHHRANERIFLYAFDLIELNGDDLRRDPLEVRKATLASIVAKASPGIRFNEHTEGDGPTVFAHACKLGLEGIVSKRKGSTYRSGRSPDWLKMKNPSAAAATREAEEDWSKSRQGHASVFARARREIAPCLGRMGRYEGRSTGRLRASSQGVEGRILPRRQGER